MFLSVSGISLAVVQRPVSVSSPYYNLSSAPYRPLPCPLFNPLGLLSVSSETDRPPSNSWCAQGGGGGEEGGGGER